MITSQEHLVDIIIVQKKTRDETHKNTREVLLKYLTELNYSYKILTLDDIRTKQIPYFNPMHKTSGLVSKQKLVIALGGDGTLLHASHYVGGDTRLLGINSAPATSKGYLCALKAQDMLEHIATLMADSNHFKNIQRLQCGLGFVPLALNDMLICHSHPAATTRTIVTLLDRKTKQIEFSQMVYSSGIWVSTVAGQTAAISSYDFPKQHEESDMIFVAIREPYFPKNEKRYPSTFAFHSADKQLSIVSKINSGLICIDGHDSCAHFGVDATVTFDTPQNGVLQLIL